MFDQKVISKISARAEQAIHDGVFPGCVIGIVDKYGNRIVCPFGRFTYDHDAAVVTEESVYDMASVTKSIPLSSLLLRFIDRGDASLKDSLVSYIPEFGNFPNKKFVTLHHLLSYTIDLDVPRMSLFKEKNADDIIAIILSAPLRHEPGSIYRYTNATACIIGLVVRKISGKNIDELAQELFFSPLNMKDSTFHPERIDLEKVAPTEFDPWRNRMIHGEVHDESTSILNKKFILGASGLFSTAPDILNFLEMLLKQGWYRGTRYFSKDMIQAMATNQLINIKDEYVGLGWELYQPWFMGQKCGFRTFGKTGFTGTCVVCDVERGVAYTILSNRTYPSRPKDSSAINAFRADIGDIIFSNLS